MGVRVWKLLRISSDEDNGSVLGVEIFGNIQNNLKIHGIAHILRHVLVLQKCTTELVRYGNFGMGFLGG